VAAPHFLKGADMSLMFIVMFAFLSLAFLASFASPSRALPTCIVTKGKEKRIINVSDAAAWLKDGWKREGAAASKAAEPDPDPEPTLAELAAKCNSGKKLDELIAVYAIDIEFAEGMTFTEKKEALVDFLSEEAEG